MGHATTGTHALNFARDDRRAMANGILVRQSTLDHVTDDLHVAMAVGAEALAWLHTILVDHAQRAPVHVADIVVIGERKAVPGLQPAVLGVTAFVGGT